MGPIRQLRARAQGRGPRSRLCLQGWAYKTTASKVAGAWPFAAISISLFAGMLGQAYIVRLSQGNDNHAIVHYIHKSKK